MELVFDDRSLLTPGVHDVTIDTVEKYFGRFQRSDRRIKLMARLFEYLATLKNAECGESVIIDGSFVMACVDEPEDIDLILVLPSGWDVLADLKPYQYNLVSKRAVKKAFGFDLFTVIAGSARETEWIGFFTRVSFKWSEKFGWPEDTLKGIVRVGL